MAESFLVDFELLGCEGLRHPWICHSKNPDRATRTSLGLRCGLQVSRILHSNEYTVCLFDHYSCIFSVDYVYFLKRILKYYCLLKFNLVADHCIYQPKE